MDILQLPDLEVKEVITENDCYHIKATIVKEREYCNRCWQNNLVRNGTKLKMYGDIPIHDKHVGIYISFKRYLCKDCRSTLYQYTESIDALHLMTSRLVKYIYTKASNNTFSALAREIGVDKKTIRNVFSNNVFCERSIMILKLLSHFKSFSHKS